MKNKYLIHIIIITFCLIVFSLTSCSTEEQPTGDELIKQNIRLDLVGRTLTYSNIAGEPLEFVIKEVDILSMEKTETKQGLAWKVRVGESLSWDIYYDIEGKSIIKTDQLFRT